MPDAAEASGSRPSRLRKSAASASSAFDWSQLSGLDADGDGEEFGALAAGHYHQDEDSDERSQQDWDEYDDSEDDYANVPSKKRGASNTTAPSSRQRNDDSDDSEQDDATGPGSMIDPALFGEARNLPHTEAENAQEVEYEPESFHRLVTSLQDTSQQAGALRQTWDTSIEAENAEFESELRAAAGFKQRKRVRRSAREQSLSPEVRALLSEANLAFVEQRLHDAIPKLEEVIRIEPTVMTAWRTLGLIYEELGEEEKSIQCRVVGAHLQSGANEEWKRLAYRSIGKNLYRQAIYCFQQAIKIDKTDVDSIWDRALLLRDLQDYKSAINGMLDILKLQPYDPSVVREIVPMLVSIQDHSRGIGILENWRLHCMNSFPIPSVDPSLSIEPLAAGAAATSNTFSVSELVTLADLKLLAHEPRETVTLLRQTARWLDGRVKETFWDVVADDREFDGDIDPQIRKERDNEGYGRQVETASPCTMDPEIRLRLGKARMMLGDFAEARHHFDVLTEGDPSDSPQIYAEVGDCYYEYKLWAEALDVLTDLASTNLETEDITLYAKLAACNHALGELEEAARLYEPVTEASPDRLEWHMGLAEVYEALGEKHKSLQVLRHVMNTLRARRTSEPFQDGSQSRTETDTSALEDGQMSFFDELGTVNNKEQRPPGKRARVNYDRQHRLKLEQQREQETLLSWRRLELLDPHVFVPQFWRTDFLFSQKAEDATTDVYSSSETKAQRELRYMQTSQWMEEAGGLIDAFCSHRRLHAAKKRKAASTSVKTSRPSLAATLGKQLGAPSGSGGIGTQAKNLLHRLQDQLMDDEFEEISNVDGSVADAQGPLKHEPSAKYLDMANFRGLSIEQWIDLFAKYCFVLTKSGGHSRSVVNELMQSLHASTVVWGRFDRMLVVQLSWLSCALYARDYETAFTSLRWLANECQFHNFPLQLTASITNGLGFHSLSRFINNKDAKFYQRRMRYTEAVAQGMQCTFSSRSKRWHVPTALLNAPPSAMNPANTLADDETNDDDEDEAESDGVNENAGVIDGSNPTSDTILDSELAKRLARPSRPSPIAEMFYGYMLLFSGGFQSSAAFFSRAYAIQPTDALLSLCATVSFLGRSTNRQTDNRHHMVLQAMTLFQQYRRARTRIAGTQTQTEVQNLAEVEYNAGRFMHHVGLAHLAVPHYRAVLAMRTSDDPLDWGLKHEAAWNLALIYTTSGSMHLARQLYEQYLTV